MSPTETHASSSVFPGYEWPPPPPSFDGSVEGHNHAQPLVHCIVCGAEGNTSFKKIRKEYIPKACSVVLVVGMIPFFWVLLPFLLLIAMVFRKTHRITVPFCSKCWFRFSIIGVVDLLLLLSLVLGIAAFVYLFSFVSGEVFFLFLLLYTAAMITASHMYKKKNSPSYKKVDSKVVMIETPLSGEIDFASR